MVRNDFDRGTTPFAPLEQLMGVFPASSGKFLPPSWRELMMRDDSPIIDFYPTNFKVDLNGKKWAWQGVALLPFVDERRLLQALSFVYPNLTAYEAERNSLGSDQIFVYRYNRLYPVLKMIYENKDPQQQKQSLEMNPEFAHGMWGTLSTDYRMVRVCDLGRLVESPVHSLPDIKKSYAICACFRDPHYPDEYIFEAKLLPNITMPPRTLKPQGLLGPYQPQIGFSQREGPRRSYSTPQPARRMIRHSLGGSDVSSPQQSSGGGEYHSSQGDSHGFRGLAPSVANSPYGSYNSPSNSWGDHTQNIYRQGGGGEVGWNSSSPYEQGQRRLSGGSGYGSPSPRGGGQSSWSYGGSGGYDEQWSNQQSPWRRQSGPSPSRWSVLPPPPPSGSSHSPHYATPPSHRRVSGVDDHQSFLPPPPPSHSPNRSNSAPYQYDQRSKRDSYHYN